jgi:hypothetical protein
MYPSLQQVNKSAAAQPDPTAQLLCARQLLLQCVCLAAATLRNLPAYMCYCLPHPAASRQLLPHELLSCKRC